LEQGVSAVTPAIIAAWTLVAVALLALGTLAYAALRNRTRRVDIESAIHTFRSLDIEAFRNLIDSSEDAFLRDHLGPGKFRKIRRQRMWAALLYARETGSAAAALARVGQAAQRSSDPKVAASGLQLAENALRLRLQSIGASFSLLTAFLLPGLQSRSLPRLVQHYEHAEDTLFRLARFSSSLPSS
jgi:hypothetical protein